MHEKNSRERCRLKVQRPWGKVAFISSFLLTTKDWLLGPLLSLFCLSLDIKFSLFFVQELDKYSYISNIEIWCMSFRKKREESIFLMISNVEVIIVLFSSSSLRVFWEKKRFFNYQDMISTRKLEPWWDQKVSDQIEVPCGCF